jgi:hypothetical protein
MIYTISLPRDVALGLYAVTRYFSD